MLLLLLLVLPVVVFDMPVSCMCLSVSVFCVCQLTARPDRVLAVHSELRDVPQYLEFIALGFLLCPSLLFHPEAKYQEIFCQAVTDQLVVPLYRDLVRPSASFLRVSPTVPMYICLSPSVCLHLTVPSVWCFRISTFMLNWRASTAATLRKRILLTSPKASR